MNNTFVGTSACINVLSARLGTVRFILLASGVNIAIKRRAIATTDVTVNCVREETLPLMKALTKRPTSINNQYIPAMRPATAALPRTPPSATGSLR